MPPLARAALRAAIVNRIAQELFHFEVLEGLTERAATWAGTTDADREHYRSLARGILRASEPVALDVAMHKAHEAARKLLPACLSETGERTLREAVTAAVAAREAHLRFGKPDREERTFEQIHDIPTAREFTVITGGRQVESAQGEGTVRS